MTTTITVEADASSKAATQKRSKISTPWGVSTLIEEVRLDQAVGDKHFTTLVQMLESEGGEYLVRFAYSTGGVARRGPVTLRADDIGDLQKGLERCPGLALLLGFEATSERVHEEREEVPRAG